MSKPKTLGMKSAYVPNAKADMRHHKKVYQRGREKAFKSEQLALFDVPDTPHSRQVDKLRRNWEDGFQRWSNEAAQDERNPLGVCGYGSMCDYCEDNTYGRPCVRALNAMCRDKHITIDYTVKNYEGVWNWMANDEPKEDYQAVNGNWCAAQ